MQQGSRKREDGAAWTAPLLRSLSTAGTSDAGTNSATFEGVTFCVGPYKRTGSEVNSPAS